MSSSSQDTAAPVFQRELDRLSAGHQDDTPPVIPYAQPILLPSSSSNPPPTATTAATREDTPSQRKLKKDEGSSRKKSLKPLVDINVTSDPTSSGSTALIMNEINNNPQKRFDEGTLIKLIFEEFPAEVKLPSLENIDDAILRMPKSGLLFETGQWIERLGNDMIWHLEPIRRVVRIPREDGQFAYFYKTSAGILVDVNKCRAPEEGMKRHFGLRPWVWQQWANLRLESFARFQKVGFFFFLFIVTPSHLPLFRVLTFFLLGFLFVRARRTTNATLRKSALWKVGDFCGTFG